MKAQTIKDIHNYNKTAGWWPEGRSMEAVKFLIISEVAEAFEEVRSGTPPVYIIQNGNKIAIEALEWPSFVLTENGNTPQEKISYQKPEGQLIEMADVAIRIGDLVGFLNRADEFGDIFPSVPVFKFTEDQHLEAKNYFGIARIICDETEDLFVRSLGAMRCLYDMSEHFGWDLDKAIEIKREYNKTRPVRHGGKRY